VSLRTAWKLYEVSGQITNRLMPILCCRWEERTAWDQTDSWWWVFRLFCQGNYSCIWRLCLT